MIRKSSVAGLVLLVSSVCATDGAAADGAAHWTSFQNGGLPATQSGPLATEWSPDMNVAWVADIDGYGQSTPIIAHGQVYVTSVSGPMKDRFLLTAFELSTGEKLWQQTYVNPSPKENTPMTSRAAPSPVADRDGCIAFFEGGLIVALDRDGELRWQRDLVADYGQLDARHGLASSLEQDDQHVYAWVERSEDPYVIALDKKSGTNLWKVPGLGSTTWASPRMIETDWGRQLVCSASGKIAGLDPQSGERLWEFTDISSNTSCTPYPCRPNRFLIGASDGRGETASGAGAASNGVIEINREGDQFVASFVWRAEKASSTFGSPIAVGEDAYIVNRTGVLYQLNLNTGERRAINRTSAGGIWATPIATQEHLYLFGYRGTTSVISLSDGEEIASNRLWEAADSESGARGGHVLYAAAPASPFLLLRRGNSLFAIAVSEAANESKAD